MAYVKLRRSDASNGELPEVCMRCGKRSGFTAAINFTRPNVGIATGLFGALLHVIVGLATSRSMAVKLPLCGRHRYHFAWRRWLLRTLLVLVIAGFAVGVFWHTELANRIGGHSIQLLFLWLVLWIVLTVTAIQVREIDAYGITLSGVSPRFVHAYDQWKRRVVSDEKPFWE